MKTEQQIKEEYNRVYHELLQPRLTKTTGYKRGKLISRYETLHWVIFE